MFKLYGNLHFVTMQHMCDDYTSFHSVSTGTQRCQEPVNKNLTSVSQFSMQST